MQRIYNPNKRIFFQIPMVLVTFLLATILLSIGGSSQKSYAADCSDVFTPLSSFVVNGVNSNKTFYVNVMNQTGVPWEMLAAIHYRETNFSHTNPSNGQGIFQFVNGDGGPYPPGPVSDAEFSRQLMFMATKLQNDYALRNTPSPASVSPRRLVSDEQDVTLIKNTLFSYNGRSNLYANQASQYGYNSATQPYEGSPYVMNRYDCARARMGIITRDYGSGIDGTDTRYGAFTIFARLRGDSYWLSTLSAYNWVPVSQQVYSDPARSTAFSATPTTTPGGSFYVRIKARNIGSASWDNSSIRVGTSSPQDRRSSFIDPTWINPVRPSSQTEATVDPGQVATFDFILHAPTQTGSYREYFNLVKEGVAWFNNPGLYIPVDVVSTAGIRNDKNIELKTGEELAIGEHILSADAQSALVLQENGNLIYYSGFRKVWSSNTPGQGAERLLMQPDGNLVLYSTNNTPLWYSGSGTTSGGATLKLQSDGNAVIYDSSSRALWSIGYLHNPDLFGYVTKAMGSSSMFQGQYIETADRKYQLTLQPDGNLVLYSQSKPIWATMTIGPNPAKYLRLQEDGNLVLYNKNNSPLWNSRTYGNGESTLVVQNDGNLVLYNSTASTWSSGTFGK